MTTTDVILPFPEDLVYNDLVENNLPPSDDAPVVSPSSSSRQDSDEHDVHTSDSPWATTTGKEFRSSFLFQSSCYLPDDDGTESETSNTQHTSTSTTLDYPLGTLHRDEVYPKQSLHESTSATSISSILKLSASNTDHLQPPRRVMFYDDDDYNNLNPLNCSSIHPINPHNDGGSGGGGNHDDTADEEKSSWVGFNRIIVPLHHEFHSLPHIPSVKTSHTTTITTIEDTYHSHHELQQHDLLQQYGDEEDPRTVASELQYNNNHSGKRTRQRQICLLAILFLLLGSMSIALTCGMTECRRAAIRQDRSSSNSSSYTTHNISSPTTTTTTTGSGTVENVSNAPTMTPSSIHPSPESERTTPTLMTQTRITVPPSMSPTLVYEKVVITSIEQLYIAVDAYLVYRFNKTIVDTGDYDYLSTPIGLWDVSQVTNFTSVFSTLRNPLMQHYFNEDIGMWDTSNAVSMEQMMYGTEKWVNGNISRWITANVTNMREMFAKASNFNEDLSLWDVSNVITMEGMCKLTFEERSTFLFLKLWNLHFCF